MQKLSKVYFKNLSKTPNLEIVASGYLTNNKEIVEAEQYYRDETTILPNLNSDTKEADTCIIPHINDISLKNNTTAVVLCNDTDVCVLEIFKDTYITEHLRTTASELRCSYATLLKMNSSTSVFHRL